MRAIRRPVLLACLYCSLIALGACQPAAEQSQSEYLPLFGNGTADNSKVVAMVNGVAITAFDLEVRYDELTEKIRKRYPGEEGQRLLLGDMVNQVLLAQGAVELGLLNNHQVARTMISNRRSVLDFAMKNLGILVDQEPSEEEIQDFYLANRTNFKKKGRMLARHVECLTKEDADLAYDRLIRGGFENRFVMVVKELSVNKSTAAEEGSLGWFNRGGFVPDIRDVKVFTNQAYDLQDGINPPFQAGGRWHIVEVQKREYERTMTFGEARPTVLNQMLPKYQNDLIEAYLTDARNTGEVEMLGKYAPGQGLDVEQLFGRARAVVDIPLKMELFEMVYTDFPESDRADDALFLAANLALDIYGDRRGCAKLLNQILKDYPESEMVPDTHYLLENLDNPKAMNPTSIEDLRR